MSTMLKEYFKTNPYLENMWSENNDPDLLNKTIGSNTKVLWKCLICK